MFDWFAGDESVPELIARGRYGKAERALRKEFAAGRRDPGLRLQLADVLLLDGRPAEAVPVYIALADEFARSGQGARAVAVLKKIEGVASARADVARRLAVLMGDHGKAAATVPEPPPVAPVEPVASVELEEALELEEPPAPAHEPGVVAPSPLFGDFSSEDLLELMGALRLVRFAPGDIVVGEGEPGASLFVISAGRVKAFVRSPSGRYAEVREMAEGDFFGEISLLSGGPRTATITAADHCELLELDRATLDGLSAAHPGVRAVLERVAAERRNSSLEAMVRGMRFGA